MVGFVFFGEMRLYFFIYINVLVNFIFGLKNKEILKDV